LFVTGNLPAGIAMWKAACAVASGAMTGAALGTGIEASR